MAALGAYLRAASDGWDRYWFEPISPYPIAAFRILFGGYLLLYFLSFWRVVPIIFSRDGVYLPFLVPDYAPPTAVAWIVYGLTLTAMVLFLIGYRTRVITPVLLVLYLYHYFLNLGGTVYSYDRLNLILLAILCCAEVDGVWSLSAGIPEQGGAPLVPAWATRLIRLEVAVMYFGSGLFKALNPQWRTGKLIEMTYQGEWGTSVSFWVARLNLPDWVYDGATWCVILFEMSMAFALYGRRSYKIAIALGTAFHLANWIFLNIPEFMVCVATYVLFVPAVTVEQLGRLIAHALRLAPRVPAPAHGVVGREMHSQHLQHEEAVHRG